MEVLELEEYHFKSFEEINELMVGLTRGISRGSGVFSGSRRIGYFIKGEG